MISNRPQIPLLITILATLMITGCDQSTTPPNELAEPDPAAIIDTSAGIQDLMRYMIDPEADFLWESVSESITVEGIEREQPETDAEWHEIKRSAFIITEAANLLQLEGRPVVMAGNQLEDQGTKGNLTLEEIEQAILLDRDIFNAFAGSLRDVGFAMMEAADNRDPEALVEAGEIMDAVCESCHLQFWYPGQEIPLFDDQAPEVRD